MGIGKNPKSAFCRKGLTPVHPSSRIPDFGRFSARMLTHVFASNLPHSVAHATGPGSRTHEYKRSTCPLRKPDELNPRNWVRHPVNKLGWLERIELSISVPQTEVLPLNYSHHDGDDIHHTTPPVGLGTRRKPFDQSLKALVAGDAKRIALTPRRTPAHAGTGLTPCCLTAAFVTFSNDRLA